MAEEDTGTLELEWRLGMGFAMSGCEVLTYWVGPRLVPLTPPPSLQFADGIWGPPSCLCQEQGPVSLQPHQSVELLQQT